MNDTEAYKETQFEKLCDAVDDWGFRLTNNVYISLILFPAVAIAASFLFKQMAIMFGMAAFLPFSLGLWYLVSQRLFVKRLWAMTVILSALTYGAYILNPHVFYGA